MSTTLESLQKDVNAIFKSLHADLAVDSYREARVDALISIVRELATRAGLSEDRFRLVLAQRTRHCHQARLKSIEEAAGNSAPRTEATAASGKDPSEEIVPLFPR